MTHRHESMSWAAPSAPETRLAPPGADVRPAHRRVLRTRRCTGAVKLHRRDEVVLADVHALGDERAVGLLRRDHEHVRAGHELRLVARLDLHDRRAGRHEHGLLAVLVLERELAGAAALLD